MSAALERTREATYAVGVYDRAGEYHTARQLWFSGALIVAKQLALAYPGKFIRVFNELSDGLTDEEARLVAREIARAGK